MSSSASAASIKYDFGLESPAPHIDRNLSGDEINMHGSPDAFSYVASTFCATARPANYIYYIYYTAHSRKELSKLQEEQIHFGRKVEREKARKEKLDTDIEVTPLAFSHGTRNN